VQREPVKRLVQERYQKYRALGGQSGYLTTAMVQELGELRDAIGRRAGSAVARIRRRPEPPAPPAEPEGEDGETLAL
jgi:hypothetical protein